MSIYITGMGFPSRDLQDTIGDYYYSTLEHARAGLWNGAEDRLEFEVWPKNLDDCNVELELDGFTEVYSAMNQEEEMVFVAWIREIHEGR